MNKGATFIFGIVLGAAAGIAVSWKYFKDKYEKIAKEEIDSVIEKFTDMKKTKSDQPKKEQNKATESELNELATLVHDEGYFNYADIDSGEEEDEDEENTQKPYVIAPSEFGEADDYEVISLYYYADGVLTDSFDEIIVDVDAIVGKESLNHFGEYEDDSVFVRNDRLKADYEILLDVRTWSQALEDRAHHMED